MQKNLIFLIVLPVLFLIGAGCSSSSSLEVPSGGQPETPTGGQPTSPPTNTTSTPTNTPGSLPAGGNSGTTTAATVEFNVTAKQFSFAPSTIIVKKGDHVIVHLTSTDVKHGFGIDEYGIKSSFDRNNPTTVEFTADKPGTFEFYCSVPCGPGHRDMAGTLIVQ